MIRVSQLRFAYHGGVEALSDISLDLHPGERVALIGANGSGKTTLARCLNGLLEPSGGRVEVDGLSPSDSDQLYEVRRLVGMVFQNPDDQLVATTVEAEIAFGLENLGVPHDEMVGRVEETLIDLNLAPYRRHPPHQLSGGEKQRLAVAACVALRPRYLVLDEPTSLLDPRSRRELMEVLERLRRDHDIATLHITQIPEEAARADRVIVLDRGRIAADGSAEEVFAGDEDLRRMGLGLPFARAAIAGLALPGLADATCLQVEDLVDALVAAVDLAGAPDGSIRDLASASEPTHGRAAGRLVTRDVWHVYDSGLPSCIESLRGVDLDVERGRALALLGPSGSGKTTLAQHLNGLLKPSRGAILLDGQNIWKGGRALPGLRRRVGLVFQFPELQLFEETVMEDVAFGPRNLSYDEAQVSALATGALELVGLCPTEFGPRRPLSLSGGERRRVAIAGVLAMDPEVLVLDEPTAGLDPRTTEVLVDILRHLRAQGRSLVLISHDMDLVGELADDIVVLSAGSVVLSGGTRHVLGHPSFAAVSGLEAPAAVRLSQQLSARGWPLPKPLINLGEVHEYLRSLSFRKA
ncbi:ABC transporter ATP-binding protein [Candidatus Latescibacterota bacterium]